jgi:tetratricopeptide (TPR) repeat protein
MNSWTKILADCVRLLPPADDGVATDKRSRRRCARPEAAFRITLRRNSASRTGLERILGGIPRIVTCVVHPVASHPQAYRLQPDEEEWPVGIVMRRARREDLYVFYRASDASLVVYTLPEKYQSTVMVAPLEDGGAIRQARLGGKVCRVAFSELTPGRYLVASFSMVSARELHRQVLLLRKHGRYDNALSVIEEVLEFDPEDFEAWTRKGCLLRLMGNREEAMVAVEKALSMNAECALAWRARGALLRDDGQHQEGLDCYLRSLQLDPTDFLCWENKGNALTALDRMGEAAEAYAEAARVRGLYPEEKY